MKTGLVLPFNQPIYPNAVMAVEIEDKGQDFLFWQLNEKGEVVFSYPFQTSTWKGTVVDLDKVDFLKELPASNRHIYALKYKPVAIYVGQWVIKPNPTGMSILVVDSRQPMEAVQANGVFNLRHVKKAIDFALGLAGYGDANKKAVK